MGHLGEDEGNRAADGVFSIRDHAFDRDLKLFKLLFDFGEQGGQIALGTTEFAQTNKLLLFPLLPERHSADEASMITPFLTKEEEWWSRVSLSGSDRGSIVRWAWSCLSHQESALSAVLLPLGRA